MKEYYGKAAALWKAVGSFLTGPLPKYLSERKGPYFGGEKPGEVDCELTTIQSSNSPVPNLPTPSELETDASFFPSIASSLPVHAIAWLARVVTAAGGSIDKLEEAIGSKLDPSVSAYYEDWTKRESFKTLGIF